MIAIMDLAKRSGTRKVVIAPSTSLNNGLPHVSQKRMHPSLSLILLYRDKARY